MDADETRMFLLSGVGLHSSAEIRVYPRLALSLPGLTVGFKVYVVLTMGNERGSAPVYLTRPV